MAYSTRKLSLVSEQEPETKAEPHLSDAARPLGTVAATLRAARLAHGSTLPEISDSLRIRLAYLEAIEDGRFDELPGTVYAIGFIRTYADHLGLDSRHLIEKYKEEADQNQSSQELHFLAAEPEKRIPGGSLMLVALLLAAVTYGVWFYISSTDRGLVDLIPDFPDRFNALLQQTPPAPGPIDLAEQSPGEPAASDAGQDETIVTSAPIEENRFGSPPEEPFPLVATPGEPIETLPSAQEAPGTEEVQVSGVQPSLTPGFDIPAAPTGLTDQLEEDPAPAAPLQDTQAAAPEQDIPAPSVETPVQPLETDTAFSVTAEPAPAASAPEPATDTAALVDQSDIVPESPGQSAAIAAARPPGPPESATFGGENEDSRVLINATAMSWVQVRDDAGNLVMTRVLQPGESYRVPNRSGLNMVTGNAGGIEIFVDGQPTPPFGRIGDVVRNIDLDPDALLNGTAVPN